ncbi:alpha-mannosidase [Planctomonas deserti]|uniref:alpha-mannosidase n=1 Tax=Planctomonas deserti TaxID=2144185 RepID=UPI000D33FBDB|nr:glycoside hydrolase family 38 C-terminal domain-containing protein [Planctomonas deserti]
MHNDSPLVLRRLQRFQSERILPAIHRSVAPLTVTAWEVPGEPVPFAEAVGQSYEEFGVGRPWGRPWGTTWLHITGTVPADWDASDARIEVVLDLGFLSGQPGFQAEGLVFRPDGSIVKAIEPFNAYVPVPVGPGGDIDLYVEAASNPDVGSDWRFAPTAVGDLETAGTDPIYVFRRADVALLDEPVWELDRDFFTLIGLLDELSDDLPRKAEILRALERVVDAVDPEDVSGTARAGRAELEGVLAKPAYASAHRVVAVGHAHIDSAWLWPVRETIRKCARTFSNVLELMEQDPDFVFACSSAQQYAWMKEYYPDLFERIRERAIEGRFVPVGGMWVESDTNMPGGEALARQLVAGKGFFQREFGIEPLEVWLPDSFGYTAALPQIVAAAGSRYFLTQKISWNETNVMPHHTFDWEGIDGTRVFTHFPPVDTYNSVLSGHELARAQRQYSEKGASNVSLVPFGFGDGGGGPTREMLAAAKRTRSLEGSPAVSLGTPRAFFEEAERDYPNPPVWSGELYLEFHRGTYTSQARTKAGNRRSEHLLREAELWCSAATVLRGADYPYEELEAAWQTVLLQQFHDILPGTSIAWVYKVAEENYAVVERSLTALIEGAIAALAGDGDADLAFNAGPFAIDGVPALGANSGSAPAPARVREEGGRVVLENERITAVLEGGLLVSLVDRASGREAIPAGDVGNLLQIFRDTPNQWDAWDIDVHYQRHGVDLREPTSVTVTEGGVRVEHTVGASTIVQTIVLEPGAAALDILTEVDWHERQKLLKLAFPLDVHADRAASEIQFGHVYRGTHINTSWDAARFETSAHRWVHVGEPGYGVAVANNATYGHDITRTTRADGGTTTRVRQSLLRAPLFPDPHADQGAHSFRTSVRPNAGILDAAYEGYRANLPLRRARGGEVPAPLVSVTGGSILVEAVKLAEDRSGDVIVRLYEASGTRSTATVTFGFDAGEPVETDLLERPLETPKAVRSGATVTLRPFQILTLRVPRGR